jgi:glyoxylase-like metal-dependent hydrolase (beta-lactamase superfamily II)
MLGNNNVGNNAMKNFDEISRRRLLAGATLSAAAGLLSVLNFDSNSGAAWAKAAMVKRPAPGFHRFKVGEFEVTVVSDGPLTLGPPSADVFKGLTKEEMTQVLANSFLPTANIELEQNTLVVNTGKNLVLFDTGTGKTIKAFGPNAGRLLGNLKAAGIDPKDIDVIALTHAHPDHCFGLMTESGKRNFPKAQIYITQSDLEFWTDEKNAPNDMFKMFIAGARKNLLPNRDRIVFVKDGQEIVPGIQAIYAPGHTVGHTIFMITSGGQTLCNTADIAHHHVISLEKPKLEFAFDTDGKQGVASRLKTFDMLASTRTQIVAYHFPWPGIGYVGKQGDAYHYYPASLRTVL